MGLIVQKFGGSSVANIEKVKKVACKVITEKENGNQVVAVVSAMGDLTDELIALAQQTGDKVEERELDMLLATGEQQSAALLALTLKNMGQAAISLTGWQAGISTDGVYGKARITNISPQRIEKEVLLGNIVVIAGFQGLSPDGDMNTLGRGGSDTTAVALAASLQADRCDIYTDVDGVYTADPRLVKEARKLKAISYDEMLEMASLGALILQPRAVEFAMHYNVALQVRSSFSNEGGTWVVEAGQMEKERAVSGVAHDLNVAKVALFDVPDQPGIASIIFKGLAQAFINVDMIIQAAMRDERNDIAFTIARDDLPRALPVVKNLVQKIGASGMAFGEEVAKVSIVGAGMKSNPGVAAVMFEALAEDGINIHMISTSEIKVSCVVDACHIERAVQALHKKFHLDEIKE